MLSWLPIVGPIIEGIVSIFNKKADTTVALQTDKNKTEVGKLQSNNATDLAVIQSRAGIVIAFKDDLGVRLVRDLIMFPTGMWVCLEFFHASFGSVLPGWTWTINPVPEAMAYIPYAVIAFLFATSWRK